MTDQSFAPGSTPPAQAEGDDEKQPVEHLPEKPGVTPAVNREGANPGELRSVEAGQRHSPPERRQSRLLKGPNPPSVPPTRRRVDEQRMALARYLTDRDRSILHAVLGHRVLRTDQITDAFFDSPQRARMRLLDLYRLGLLDRFQPYRPNWGSEPYHYLIGRWGAAILAGEGDRDPDSALRRWKADRALALAGSQRLAHLLGIGGFYTALAGYARRAPGADLIDWMPEVDAARWSADQVHPDAFGAWREGGQAVEFFLEYDRGSETLARLVAKLSGYERFEEERGAVAWVLFAFESARREATARRALTGATVAVATAALTGDRRPYDAVWLALAAEHERVRLADLASLPVPAASRERTGDGTRFWMYDRGVGIGTGRPGAPPAAL